MNRFQICILEQNFTELQHAIVVTVEEMNSDSRPDTVNQNLMILNAPINKKNFFCINQLSEKRLLPDMA